VIRRTAVALLLALPLALPVAACGGGTAEDTASSAPASSDTPEASTPAETSAAAASSAGSSPAGPALSGEVLVSAASSLTDAFDEIGTDFQAANPGVTVTFSYGPSSGLATQITEGAPADVAAFASGKTMQTLADAGLLAADAQTFASNELVIVTKPGNPEGITGLADLATAGVISLCGEDVPCGSFAGETLTKAGVTIPETSVTRGTDVKATLTAVSEGDAVAGIVYVTDALVAGDAVTTVPIPADVNSIASYPIAVVGASKNAGAAQAFVDYVLGPEGQAVLKEYGFLPPA
jgi:molybdate transport system substrate-binding protein